MFSGIIAQSGIGYVSDSPTLLAGQGHFAQDSQNLSATLIERYLTLLERLSYSAKAKIGHRAKVAL